MTKYRKKPVIIDAIQWKKDLNLYDLKDFLEDVNKDCSLLYEITESNEMRYFIRTLEGDMDVDYTDYIIKGVQKEIYPCKEQIFLATYEKVEDNG